MLQASGNNKRDVYRSVDRKNWNIHAARARFSKVWYLHCRVNRHAYGHIGLCRYINPPYFSNFNCLILWWSQNLKSCIYMFSVSGYKITLSYKRENPDFRHIWSCTLMYSTTASGLMKMSHSCKICIVVFHLDIWLVKIWAHSWLK